MAGLVAICIGTTFVTGLIGAGGGILFLPLALYALPLVTRRVPDTHVLTGLSLVQGLFATTAAGFQSRRQGLVAREHLRLNGPVLAAAGLAGAAASVLLPARTLLIVFALVTSASVLLLLLRAPERAEPHRWSRPAAAGLFAGIGLIGGAIGVGANFLTIPVLVWVLGMDLRQATGTGFVLSFFLLAPALAGKALTGQVDPGLGVAVALAALLGASLGAALSPRLPAAGMRLGLAGLVAVLALRVWVDVLR